MKTGDPVMRPVGTAAEALSKALGCEVDPTDTVVVIPPRLTPQWFVDNATITSDNEAVWWALSAPDRIVYTRMMVKRACRELTDLATDLKRQLGAKRSAMLRTKRRDILQELPDLAARIEQAEAIHKTLRQTLAGLDTMHARLSHAFNNPAPKKD